MRLSSVYRLLKLRVWVAERFRTGDTPTTYFWAGIVGLAGGASGPAFRWLCRELQWLFVGNTQDLVAAADALPDWRRLLVPAVGGLIAGLVLMLGARLLKGQRAADYMEAVTIGDGHIRPAPALVRIGSSIFSIASGGSLGREGPISQLAALLASGIGRLARLPKPRLQLMVACGAAAGMASAYNAPIGGALFVAEVVLGTIAMESFGPLLFASFMSSVLTRALGGGSPLFEMQAFHLVSYVELFAYLGLGLLAGALAPGFLWLLQSSTGLFARLPLPLAGRMALGGLIVGAVSVFYPYVWGNGQGALVMILHTDWLSSFLLVLLAVKVVATAATIGSGAVGGVFTPTLLVGAILGALVGNGVHGFAPEHTGVPAFYALVGAGALLAATTHAPLMAILILFDMTLAHEIVLPLMLACVCAHVVAQALRPTSIYAVPRKVREEDPPARETLASLTVAALLRPDPPRISSSARFGEILEAFVGRRHNNLYVVDAAGVFQGVIPLHEIKSMLNDPELHRLTIADDFLREEFPRVRRETPLAEALKMFTTHPLERLPVVDGRGQLVGSISKTDLLLTLAGTEAHAKT